MKKHILLGAVSALAIPSAAFAQSTGSVEFENKGIVVTGTRTHDVAGVQVPDTSKAKVVLTDKFIQHQTPGQSINDIINQLPGVSFQNNDPYGSAGGTLTIRGFDNSRISETFDGVPLNDSGNYALFSNQQLDPELIEQVNVNLGSTDVDSPTAAATGSTVNYRTRLPTRDFHARIQGSVGDFNFFRIFGVIDTGEFGPWGTRAFFAASHAENHNFPDRSDGRIGRIDKQQYNGRIYQPIGSNGDFISVAGHYNQNRNNFLGSVPLRTDLTQSPTNPAPRVAGSGTANRFPLTNGERFYTVPLCQVAAARTGVADTANTCGTTFDERFNPSNTGNVRIQSRFTLADHLVLTVDPSYQYVKANGGGTVTGREGLRDVDPRANVTVLEPGFVGGSPFTGIDLNGDGDLLDQVTLLAPSQTQTHRYGVIASLRYDINEDNTLRVAYTLDHAHHRQTGEVGFLQPNGQPFDVFPVNNPLRDVSGAILEKRDRNSYAILNQVSGEYRGQFFDRRLTVNLGIRAPFFKRDLNNFCFTTSASGNVDCFSSNAVAAAAYAAANPTVVIAGAAQPLQGPQHRVLNFNRVLPNAGIIYNLAPRVSLFANYSKGLQVPGTDNLYNTFFFAADSPAAHPKPETTDNFDAGLRYRSATVMAQVSGWYTRFQNRLASAFDPIENVTIFRNLGIVDKYGVDALMSYQPMPQLQLSAFASYLKSKIKDNVQIGGTSTAICNVTTPDLTQCALTAGKRESGAPVYTFGGRIDGRIGPLEIGIQAKRTGPRFENDQNLPLMVNGVQVFTAKVPAYTLVDLDARLPLKFLGFNDSTWFQLNVTNLFDKLYVGGFGGGLSNTSVPFVQIGAPRAISGTLVIGF